MKTFFFFFWDHLILDRKTLWICLNPIEIKWKFGSSSLTVEPNFIKSLSSLRNPGYATVHSWDLKTLKWLQIYVYSSVWRQLLTNLNLSKHQDQTSSMPQYAVLLQKGWNQLKGYYRVIFQACLIHSNVPSAWIEGTGIFLPEPEMESYLEANSFRMITLTSFQLKWSARLILYHIDESNNVQAKLSASQYGFRTGVFTETVLHEFVRRVEHWLVRKKPTLLQMPAEQIKKTKVLREISNVKL